MTALSQASLGAITVPAPSYRRNELAVGIMHLGLGAFHRAHQAMYSDQLLERRIDMDWAIESVGVLPDNDDIVRALTAQDGLYTLVLKYPDGRWQPRVIGSIARASLAPADPGYLIDRLSDPAVRIITMTITEGGYLIDNATGQFCADDPAVWADLQPGAVPHTAFGYLKAALARRFDMGTPPPVILSCDNVFGNGSVTATTLVEYTRLFDPALADRIAQQVHFPNCMVDRITPALGTDDRAELRSRYGIDDRWPVMCEPFVQWVVEDDFPTGRPHWESVGVQMVSDVRPYELMKLRLLNAGHQMLAYPGALMGLDYVHQAASEPLIADFLERYYRLEAIPVLPPTPGIDAFEYCRTTVERFTNPQIADTLDRIRAHASDRIPKFIMPTVLANVKRGGPITCAAIAIAAWGMCVRGCDERGRSLELADGLSDTLREAATEGPAAFVAQRQVFGDIGNDPRFAQAVIHAWEGIDRNGIAAVMHDVIEQGIA